MGLDLKQFLQVMQLLSSRRLSWDATYRAKRHTGQVKFTQQESQSELEVMQYAAYEWANLDMSI